MIEIKALSKIYGKGDYAETALSNINLSINEGEMVAIMGPSGSGKTTLLNIIGGMDTISSGEYYCDDICISKLNNYSLCRFRRDNIGFVFQQFSLMSRYTVRENIELPFMIKGIRGKTKRKKSDQIMRDLGIFDLRNKRVTKISGGEKQRCAIGRVMASDSRIILADEPTGALDSENGIAIMKIFAALKENGKTIIVVTHDLSIAEKCDRIIHLKDGQIVS